MKVIKKISVTFLFLVFALRGIPQQSNTDSLIKISRTLKADSSKVKALNSLGWELSRSNPDTSIQVSIQALALAEKIKFERGIGAAYHNLGWFNYLLGNYKEALEYNLKALSIWENMYPPSGGQKAASTIGNIGAVYYSQGDLTKALDYYFKRLKLDEASCNRKGMASALSNIGIVYTDQANYPKALEYYFRSLKVEEESGNKEGLAKTLGNIGVLYRNQNDYPKALNYYQRALKLFEELGDDNFISITLGNIAGIYEFQAYLSTQPSLKAELLGKALSYALRSLRLKEKIGDQYGVAFTLGNIGMIYHEQAIGSSTFSEKAELFSKAHECYFRSLKIKEEIGDKAGVAVSLGNIGSFYLMTNKYTEARKYLENARSISEEVGDREGLKDIYENLIRLDSITGDFKGAFGYYKKYIVLSDSISNQENTRKQTQLEMQFEFDKKQAADSVRVAEEKKVAAAELRAEKNKRYSLYGGLGLVIVFAGFIYNRFRITQKQKKIIEEQKLVVETQKQIVEEKNKEVTDSIYYARRIQQSLLPTEKYIKKVLKN